MHTRMSPSPCPTTGPLVVSGYARTWTRARTSAYLRHLGTTGLRLLGLQPRHAVRRRRLQRRSRMQRQRRNSEWCHVWYRFAMPDLTETTGRTAGYLGRVHFVGFWQSRLLRWQVPAQRCPSQLSDCLLVSLVDGYNLPMSITNNAGCSVADCPVDLGPNCTEHHLEYPTIC